MGMAIECLLEEELPEAPTMEGKSLLAAYLGELNDSESAEPASTDDIIQVDFGGTGAQSGPGETKFRFRLGALDAFINSTREPIPIQWHDANEGLAVVRRILPALREGTATVSAPPDYLPGFEDDEELMEGVIFDLETLEEILVIAGERGVRFALSYSV